VSAPQSDICPSNAPLDLPGHVPALDGIRGIAVLQVFVAHFHWIISTDPYFNAVTPWHWLNKTLEPGFLGVDIFFVLSGFLITSLLLKDRQRNQSGMFRRFYMRRALRLLPALYAILIVDFFVARWEKFPMDIQWRTTWHALLYLNNWNVVWHFNAAQNDLGHLWSLGIEEQFYIIWPAILIALVALKIPNKAMMGLVAITIAVVAWHRTELWNQGVSWFFLYIRTDTRVDSLLVGALFALIYRHIRINRKMLNYSASIAFLGIVYIKYNPAGSFIYQGGFTVIALLAGMVILAAAENAWIGNGVLTWKPLAVLGKVSYGLYLWHLLIFQVMGRHFTWGPNSVRIAIGIMIVSAVTAASWFFVEKPFLRLKDRRFSSADSK
jgi:peptidoglycan/LPS O-acetylase OafA/YrhL